MIRTEISPSPWPPRCHAVAPLLRLSLGGAQTLYCGNALHDQLVQVTRASLRLLSAGTKQLLHEWRPPSGLSIDVAAGSPSQALIAAGDGNLVYLEISEGQVTERAHTKLDSEIACLDLSPIGIHIGLLAAALQLHGRCSAVHAAEPVV